MHRERIKKLRDKLRTLEQEHIHASGCGIAHYVGDLDDAETFNMAYWRCGTAGCMAAWTVQLFGHEEKGYPIRYDEFAGELLCLNGHQADLLFSPPLGCFGFGERTALHDVTPDMAADVLDLMLKGLTIRDAWITALRSGGATP